MFVHFFTNRNALNIFDDLYHCYDGILFYGKLSQISKSDHFAEKIFTEYYINSLGGSQWHA